MAYSLHTAILVFITIAIQNAFGDTEHFLRSNAETGDRISWEETGEETPGREKRNVLFPTGLTQAEIREIVNAHNKYRAFNQTDPEAANMRQVRWSSLIAENAMNYTCKCNSYHSSDASRQIPGLGKVGENIWAGTHHRSHDGAVKSFYNEKQYYDYWTGACSKRPCGHYTAGVWHNTYLVGCGFRRCPEAIGFIAGKKAYLFVCQMYHVGNYVGTKPYENGTVCSNCPSGWQGGCDDGLCTPDTKCGGDTCQNGGAWNNDSSCTCDCPEGFVGAYCESPEKEECPPLPTSAPEETVTNGNDNDNGDVNETTDGGNSTGIRVEWGSHGVYSFYAILIGMFLVIYGVDCI